MNKLICRFYLFALIICAFAIVSSATFAYASAGGAISMNGAKYSARFLNGKFEYYSKNSAKPDMVYSLRSIRLGNDLILVKNAPKAVSAKKSVCYYYDDNVSEIYSALKNGVEQSWKIKSRPHSAGDIVIEGNITSPLNSVNRGGGVVFQDADGRDVLNYGSVTVIDDNDKTYKCSPKIVNNRIAIIIPEVYVKSAKFPILVDPVVGSEMPIVPTFAPAPNTHTDVEIAASPYGYFAVWTDRRSENADPKTATTDIFGCRLSPSGQILDVMGIAISTAAGDQMDPSVEWNGQEYLVVWSDRRGSFQHIYGARVLPTGEVIDKQGILISGTYGTQAYPRLASDGSGWEVVWQDARGSTPDIYGCRVNGDGTLGKVSGIATKTSNEQLPDIAWNGSSYFYVIWSEQRTDLDICGCKVSKAGSRLGSDILISTASGSSTTGAPKDQYNPRFCSSGTSMMAVWEDTRNTSSGCDIYGTRVSASGTVLNIGGVCICNSTGDQKYPGVSYDGNKILVAWRESGSLFIRGARLDGNANLLDPSGISISKSMAGPYSISVKGGQNSFILGWGNLDIMNAQAQVALVSDNGAISTQLGNSGSISTAAEDRPDYCVIDNGSEYVIVWSQLVNKNWDILGVRMSRSGALLDSVPINFTSWLAGDQTQPSIAWNGSCYLLVWRGNERYSYTDWDIRGCFLDQNLTRIGTAALSICAAQLEQARPYVTSNGTGFLATWEDSRNAISPSYFTDIYASTINAAGTVTPTTPEVCIATGDQHKPRAVSNGTDYLVVWEDERSVYPVIRGSRVSSASKVQDTATITFPATSYYQTTPDVCYGGGNYFVAWSDYYSITGTRVSSAGAVLDKSGIVIDNVLALKACPSVCWDGSKYQVVWEDYRSKLSGNSDIYHTSVPADGGSVIDLKTVLISDMVAQYRPHIFATSGTGELFYSKFYNYSNILCASSLTDQSAQDVDNISNAKNLPTGSMVHLQGKVVTYVGSGFFYIEEPNRSNGIKVVTNLSVQKNEIVDVVGSIAISDGERYMTAGAINNYEIAENPPTPLAIRGDVLGGGSLNQYTPGITGASGLNNMGLLVTTWGKVTAIGTNCFYIESKPGVSIKVISGSFVQPAVGNFVTVTGISTCEVISGSTGRAILPREQNDINVIK